MGLKIQWMAVCMAFLMLVVMVAAAEVETHDESQRSPLAFIEADDPSWMGRILGKLTKTKYPAWYLEKHVLYRHNKEPSFLALLWKKRSDYLFGGMLFELYRVNVISASNVRLKFLREVKEAILEIKEPIGADVFGDGIATIFLRYWKGGMLRFMEGIRIIRLKRSSVDVTPRWRVEEIKDLNSDSRFEFLASDDSFAGMFWGCSRCGPYVPVVMSVKRSRLVESCTDYRTIYNEQVRYFRGKLKEIGNNRVSVFLYLNTEIALNLVQMGEVKQGQKHFLEAIAEAKRRGQDWKWSRKKGAFDFGRSEEGSSDGIYSKTYNEWVRLADSAITPMLTRADSSLPCPLASDTRSGRHDGIIRRIVRD